MRVGIIVPQGWTQEYVGVEPRQAWQRTRSVARRADELGFESIWLFDHFHTVPTTVETTTFELFTTLSALATATRRVRLGQLVTCAGYRNPALLAKMISTLDVISDGRVELGLGAGWKGDEWDAYGYGFPSLRIRQDMLQDALAIVTLMWAAGRATYTGDAARVTGAVNEPKPLQVAHPPIVVGGNGRQRTWRLAARYADELNLDAVPPEAMADAMAVIRSRCEEIDRDPNSLRVSVHIWWEHLDGALLVRRCWTPIGKPASPVSGPSCGTPPTTSMLSTDSGRTAWRQGSNSTRCDGPRRHPDPRVREA